LRFLTPAASQVMQDAIDLKSAGMQIDPADPAELSEKTGYTLEPASSKQ